MVFGLHVMYQHLGRYPSELCIDFVSLRYVCAPTASSFSFKSRYEQFTEAEQVVIICV